MNLHSTAAWDWLTKWDLPINPTKSNSQSTRSSPEIVFFSSMGLATPIPVPKLVKDLGVHADNMFSPSTQCTEAASKARRLLFMIGRSFQDLSKSVFSPLYGALLRPNLEYGMPACSPNLVADINHLERIQTVATRLLTGMRNLPYEERLQRLGLHFLPRRRLRAYLITAFKIFKGILDNDLKLFFLPPARRGLRGTPSRYSKVRDRRRRVSAFSVRVVKYWNKLAASVVTAPSVNFSRDSWRRFGKKSFPISPID